MGLSSRPILRTFLSFAPYALAVYLGLGFVAYGYAWRAFKQTPVWVLSTGGRVVDGKVLSLTSSGLGRYKDYFIRVEGSLEEFMIPFTLIFPRWDAGADIDVGSIVHPGQRVHLASSGGEKPVVLGLTITSMGIADRPVLDYNVSAARFRGTMEHAEEFSKRYVTIGLALLPLTLIGRLFFWLARRRAR